MSGSTPTEDEGTPTADENSPAADGSSSSAADAKAESSGSAKDTASGKADTSGKGGKPPVPPAAKRKAEIRAKAGKGGTRSRTPVKIGSPQWLLPLMLALFIIGIIWIVAYYVAPDAPWISTLGWWNVVIGFGFLAAGFVVATRWR